MIKVKGKVIKGRQKGRLFGFPTANIELPDKVDSGVYRGRVIIGDKKYKAAVFIWPDQTLLEAYLLDFSGDLYDQEIEVEILSKLREARKFNNEAELIEQIKQDVKMAADSE